MKVQFLRALGPLVAVSIVAGCAGWTGINKELLPRIARDHPERRIRVVSQDSTLEFIRSKVVGDTLRGQVRLRGGIHEVELGLADIDSIAVRRDFRKPARIVAGTLLLAGIVFVAFANHSNPIK